MGSLLSGWDSHVPDPKTVKFERNKSLTKEEIATFWKSKKLAHHEDFQENTGELESGEKKYKRSNSLPLVSTNMKQNLMDMDSDTVQPYHDDQDRMEKLLKKNGWWISSNWAFLNEPPVITSEAPTYKYASQFHVAGRSCSSHT